MRTKGAAAVSGLDAEDCRGTLKSKIFRTAVAGLRRSIACLTRIMCKIRNAYLESLALLLACRLMPLDKILGMISIGIGEVIRRIIGKAVTKWRYQYKR